jgi:hypothetical protein
LALAGAALTRTAKTEFAWLRSRADRADLVAVVGPLRRRLQVAGSILVLWPLLTPLGLLLSEMQAGDIVMPMSRMRAEPPARLVTCGPVRRAAIAARWS